MYQHYLYIQAYLILQVICISKSELEKKAQEIRRCKNYHGNRRSIDAKSQIISSIPEFQAK